MSQRGNYRGGGYGGAGGRGGRGTGPIFQYPASVALAPNETVTQLENQIQANKTKTPVKPEDLDFSQISLFEQFPRRPAFGSFGQPISVWANYFELTASRPKKELLYYTIKVSATASSRKGKKSGDSSKVADKKLRQVVRILLSEYDPFQTLQSQLASDFSQIIIAGAPIPLADGTSQTFAVKYHDEHAELNADIGPEILGRRQVYNVTVTYNTTFPLATVLDYVRSPQYGAHLSDRTMLQLLNVLISTHAKRSDDLLVLGQNKVFPLRDKPFDLKHGLVAFRGFFASVRLATNRILVNVNVNHGAFYPPSTLAHQIKAVGSNIPAIHAYVKGLRVRLTHLPITKSRSGRSIFRVKTIAGLATKSDGTGLPKPPQVKSNGDNAKGVQFWLGKDAENGQYISVFDYFQQNYGTKMQPMPILNVGTVSDPQYLPAEVCEILPGQTYSKKLNPDQTGEMIRFAVRPPGETAQAIATDGLRNTGLQRGSSAILESFGLQASQQLITVPARVLPGPSVSYLSSTQRPETIAVVSGSWNMRNIRFNRAQEVPRWGCIRVRIVEQPGQDRKDGFFRAQTRRFGAALPSLGMSGHKQGSFQTLLLNSRTTTDDILKARLLDTVKNCFAKEQLRFILFILPKKESRLYNKIKMVCDLEVGMHSICVTEPTLERYMDADGGPKHNEHQLFANLALKLNLKLGGVNQVVISKQLRALADHKTMVVGLDVTHPSPGSSSDAPSIAGIVASIDGRLAQWLPDLRIQRINRDEMISDLKSMLASRLRHWYGIHKAYPENILIYRDGVSEGQYELVMRHELPELRKACQELYPATQQNAGLPRMTIVVVGKRHHTRFYPTNAADSQGNHSNCKPGTVVDRGITEARNWDFFLQAHAAIQGTARPAHYQVILDEIFTGSMSSKKPDSRWARELNKQDTLEELTLAMSHVFGRATKVISTPAPARYADMVCERARCYLERFFEPPLRQNLDEHASSEERSMQMPLDQVAVQVHRLLKDTMLYI